MGYIQGKGKSISKRNIVGLIDKRGRKVALDGKVKVSSNDANINYLENKLTAGTGVSLTINNEGGDENILIDNSDGVNIETISVDKYLLMTDVKYQNIKPTINVAITLPTANLIVGKIFIIRNLADCNSLPNTKNLCVLNFEGINYQYISPGSMKSFIYDGNWWTGCDIFTGISSSTPLGCNLSLGGDAIAGDKGIAIGYESRATRESISIGTET